MSAVSAANMLVFYDPIQIPDKITSKMIHRTRDLPLPADQEWKKPFIMDRDHILAERIQAALVNGPFVAEAKLGPKFYDKEPTKFTGQIQTHPELSVYGWTPAQRKPDTDDGAYQEIIVCGVRKSGDTEHVCYVLAEEIKTDWPSGIAEHQKTANKVYVSSVRKFSDYLLSMYSPATEKEEELGSKSIALRAADLEMRIAALKEQITRDKS